MIKPVLLTCPAYAILQSALINFCQAAQPTCSYYQDSMEYSIFEVADPGTQASFQAILASAPTPIAVADGHHRLATAQALFNEGTQGTTFGRIPGIVMSADSLGISSFITSVQLTVGGTVAGTLEQLSQYFRVEEIPTPQAPAAGGYWLLAIGGRYFRLSGNEREEDLDPIWFDSTILKELFGISDSSSDPRVDSVEPGAQLSVIQNLTQQQPEVFHFLGYPLSMREFFDCLRRGKLLPPKSTRFFPRLPSGLLVYERET